MMSGSKGSALGTGLFTRHAPIVMDTCRWPDVHLALRAGASTLGCAESFSWCRALGASSPRGVHRDGRPVPLLP
jgi:hypothetical protein